MTTMPMRQVVTIDPPRPSWHARSITRTITRGEPIPVRPDLAGTGRHRRRAAPSWWAIGAALITGYRRALLVVAAAVAVGVAWLVAPTLWAQIATAAVLVGWPVVWEARELLALTAADPHPYARLYRGWEVGNGKGGKP